MKKVIKIVEWGVFAILLCLLLLVASPYLPTKQYLASYAIVSGSMEPTVPLGAITFVKQVSSKDLQKGDIIAFVDPNDHKKVVLHRIYAVRGTAYKRVFITKGDHNPAADNWLVTPAFLKGKYLFDLPYIGFITMFLKTPVGFGIIIGIPALVLIVMNVMKIREGVKEEIERGIAKKEKSSEPATSKLTALLVPFLLLALATGGIHPIHGLAFNSARLSNLSISTANRVVTPTPTPTTCPTGTTIIISGNGNGSQNTVNVTNTENTTVNQTNNTTVTTTINSSSNTGNNTTSNTSSTTSVTTGSTNQTVTVVTQAGSNEANLVGK